MYLQIHIFQVMNAKVQSWFYIKTKLVSSPPPPPPTAVTNHQRKWIKSKAKWTWSQDEDVQYEMLENCSVSPVSARAQTWASQAECHKRWAQSDTLRFLSGSRVMRTLLAGALEPLCSQSFQGSGDIVHTLLKSRSRKYSFQKSWFLQN